MGLMSVFSNLVIRPQSSPNFKLSSCDSEALSRKVGLLLVVCKNGYGYDRQNRRRQHIFMHINMTIYNNIVYSEYSTQSILAKMDMANGILVN